MRVYSLTKAHIQHINNISKAKLKISLLNIKNIENYPFLLIVESTIENAIKVSIYPLKREKIIKVTFAGFSFSTDLIDQISRILQNFEIIHTSGVLIVKNRLFYECYLNLSLTEPRVMDLKASLDRIKNVFKEIKIEEIAVIKTKEN